MSRMWNVEFADYSGIGRFDLLARKGTTEAEIECKCTSNDTGRKVHRQEVNRLADLLLPATQKLADEDGCHLIRITVPNRLGKSVNELAGIAALVAAAAERKSSASSEFASVEYSAQDLQSWPEPSRHPDARAFFEEKFGLANEHLLFHGRRDRAIVVVAIGSAQPDSVVEAMSKSAKEAAEQCSGSRPAVIAVHLVDQLGRSELRELIETRSGLQRITEAVFSRIERLHVDTVLFTVPQMLQTNTAGATRLSGFAAALYNPEPRFPCDEIRTVFRSN
jgi:hypothetical protein